jgi:hypothetical protein
VLCQVVHVKLEFVTLLLDTLILVIKCTLVTPGMHCHNTYFQHCGRARQKEILIKNDRIQKARTECKK